MQEAVCAAYHVASWGDFAGGAIMGAGFALAAVPLLAVGWWLGGALWRALEGQ